MDVEIFDSRKKKFRIQKCPNSCGRGLRDFVHARKKSGKLKIIISRTRAGTPFAIFALFWQREAGIKNT